MSNKEKNFASAVVYVHNAADRAKSFLETILQVMEENFEHGEIICVNDCSEDHSVAEIKKISGFARHTSISVVNLSYFHGLEMAMNAGVSLAIGDFVFEFDNTFLDFSPEIIMDVYRQAMQGYDIVSASANRRDTVSSYLFYKLFSYYGNFHGKISTESFRVISRRAINRVATMHKSIPYRKAAYANCGLKTWNIRYAPLKENANKRDKKELKFRTSLAVDSLIFFTNFGYSFSKFLTVLMMLVSVFMTVYSVVIYATSSPVAGWTTTILFLSVAFFGLFGILTIIIKYLQLLIDLVYKRKQFSFESIEKLTK